MAKSMSPGKCNHVKAFGSNSAFAESLCSKRVSLQWSGGLAGWLMIYSNGFASPRSTPKWKQGCLRYFTFSLTKPSPYQGLPLFLQPVTCGFHWVRKAGWSCLHNITHQPISNHWVARLERTITKAYMYFQLLFGCTASVEGLIPFRLPPRWVCLLWLYVFSAI